ncbi:MULTISPECIES: glycosyltransferase family 39 protein [Pseudoxanthomonas]|uniref:4-amino-4-deoxy-L-arabinose transferase-like glycosyltransferase n=2 Tax=Pseudoxanthomonas winnipegensis TaxID=2480810 RepID=A0AAW8GCS8_9GAMM|nr:MULTISPECIES: glycosyltransferase family 39 protein [Pseudoxanthomonas]MDQ1119632.1 4-amino-4-deoxy-L-arabinose transferase-like glycosyltransferase [Pseudoxanthomonas winnipegensis]MDQ1132827.1 4-amino-4-deoxy-L-arabinose transferase-like glycosyltransferase [Pseudoxanthomonas winnipegensis]MDR6137166.1 4-amino-4-deoxy-L-arabinose transferase-like glycosyltransferase [Pseudoxanthomonas sp. SORGH_AS_0997]
MRSMLPRAAFKVSRFSVAMVIIVLVGLVFRLDFMLTSHVVNDIAGDINDYVNYALNLRLHGVYSSMPPEAGSPVPDAFRPPGYPLFLALAMWLAGPEGNWILWAKSLQVLASVLTIPLTVMLGRRWMPAYAALAAGTLLALWPHSIVFSSTLLSETLFGFFCTLSLWLLCRAYEQPSPTSAVAAGTAFGLGSLVNTLLLPFPLLAIPLLWSRLGRNLSLLFLVVTLAPVSIWQLAHPTADSAPAPRDRALINLVQGAWPQYHLAWRTRKNNEISRQILAAIDEQAVAMRAHPLSEMRVMLDRLGQEPARYARWYLFDKPRALWGWDIQLGWKSVYFLETPVSPYERQPVPRLTLKLAYHLNGLLALLAIAGAVLALWRATSVQEPSHPGVMTALFFTYVTLIHTLLQAEPRYGIAYRPEEFLLACSLPAILLRQRKRAASRERR